MTATKIPAAKLIAGNVFADPTTGKPLTVAETPIHDGKQVSVKFTSDTTIGLGQLNFKPAEVVTILPRNGMPDVAINPERTGGPTGYCSNRNHKKCPYRPGGKCENGIAMPNGGFYMCSCSCHAPQKHAVIGQRDAFARARAAEDKAKASVAAQFTEDPADEAVEQPKAEKPARARKSVVATLVADHTAPGKPATALKASGKGKGQRPAKPGGIGGAKAALKPAKEGLSTVEKREARIKMAAVLRAVGRGMVPADRLTAREMVYVEAHWLKYIDPDMDKARREAAAAK